MSIKFLVLGGGGIFWVWGGGSADFIFLAWPPPPAEPRGEQKTFLVQILGGEKTFKIW